MVLENNTATVLNVSIASYSASVGLEFAKGATVITKIHQQSEDALDLDAFSLGNLAALQASDVDKIDKSIHIKELIEFPSGQPI